MSAQLVMIISIQRRPPDRPPAFSFFSSSFLPFPLRKLPYVNLNCRFDAGNDVLDSNPCHNRTAPSPPDSSFPAVALT